MYSILSCTVQVHYKRKCNGTTSSCSSGDDYAELEHHVKCKNKKRNLMELPSFDLGTSRKFMQVCIEVCEARAAFSR
jgi:hypothetical protein